MEAVALIAPIKSESTSSFSMERTKGFGRASAGGIVAIPNDWFKGKIGRTLTFGEVN